MAKAKPADDGLVTVYPKRVCVIYGVPHREQRVTPDRAAELCAFMKGGAFTTDPDDPERLFPPIPPAEGAAQPTDGPQPGPSAPQEV